MISPANCWALKRPSLYGLIIAFAFCFTLLGGEQTPPPADPRTACLAQLERMNGEFRGNYAAARAALLASEGPILLLAGDEIVLLHNSQRTAVTYVPPEYHALKSISHVPLWAYVMLRDTVDRPWDRATTMTVRNFRSTLHESRESLTEAAFPAGTIDRQLHILNHALNLADTALAKSSLTRAQFIAYCRAAAPDLWANVADVTRLELVALDAQVQNFRQELGTEDWARVRVVVEGAHTPRAGNLAMQYFRRILGPDVDDNRLVYAENAFDETKALNVLGTVRQDIGVGEAFFGDPKRMLRDLLADSTSQWLDEHFGQVAKPQPVSQPRVRASQPSRSLRCHRR